MEDEFKLLTRATAKVVNADTGKEIPLGSQVSTNSGEVWTLDSFTPPHKPSSTGRVYLTRMVGNDEQSGQYFPSVINAKIVER